MESLTKNSEGILERIHRPYTYFHHLIGIKDKLKIEKSSIRKVVSITISIVILIIPDIMLNFEWDVLSVATIISKICLLVFSGLILLQITKSYFISYLILGIPYMISSIPEIINIIILDWYMNTDGMKALYFSSKSEAVEFFDKFYIYFIIPFLLIVSYIFVLVRYRSLSYRVRNHKTIALLALIVLSLSIVISTIRLSKTASFYTDKNLVEWAFRRYYVEEHPANFYYRIYHLAVINKRNNNYKAHKENFNFGVLNAQDSTRPKVVVFIIGEAMRFVNWSINGYPKETSPRLKKMNNLITFSNHYSNANSTSISIPLIITQATPHSFNEAYYQKSIVSLFKEADYETSWISSSPGVLNYLDNRHEPDFLYDLKGKYKRHTDLGIVPALDLVLDKVSEKNKFIVINMRGAHDEPPLAYNLFRPNSSKKNYPLSIKHRDIFVNDYDNMILFQDYVISEAINLLKNKEQSSVLVFTSDHATHLFDEGHSLFGYGSAIPTEIETHVPLFVWGSDGYIAQWSDKFKNLLIHKSCLTTNDNLFYTLADIANIKYHTFKNNLSLADSSFCEPQSRFVYTTSGLFEFINENY